MTTTARVWWLSWYFPIHLARDKRIAAKWPPGVKGWTTGQTCEDEPRATWCGRVEAPSADAAKAKVVAMYGELATALAWRFEPEEKPAGWQPPGDRFPR